jgi:radical SAM/Cys-rich protein
MSKVLTKLSATEQIDVLSNAPSFIDKMKAANLFPLKPRNLEILQINVGYMCNQQCVHCHVDASPYRKEITTKDVLQACLDVVDHAELKTVDLTGGAPEMNPHFEWLLQELSNRKVEIIVRSNLTILVEGKFKTFPDLFKKFGVTVVSSLPCYTAENTDKQRGSGVFNKSIQALKKLNSLGYGIEEGLNLHLVFNPGGPFVAPNQKKLEADYKLRLKEDFGIDFTQLYTITNLPIARYLEYLLSVDRYDDYMMLLANSFNPLAASEVMCRNTLSVDWNGDLYDCDFNQMLTLPVAVPSSRNIKDFDADELKNRNIVLNNHCFGCTAGEGSSCQGALT